MSEFQHVLFISEEVAPLESDIWTFFWAIVKKQGPMNGHSCHRSIVTLNRNTSVQDQESMRTLEVRTLKHEPKVKHISSFEAE